MRYTQTWAIQLKQQWLNTDLKWATNNKFSNTTTLDKVPRYTDCLIEEAIKIRLHPRNFNTDKVSISVNPGTQ
jgi:hypothetical protein